MIEYKKTFLDEMKTFFHYFVELSEDGSILLKIYPKDFAVRVPNKRLIIMIRNNESIFIVNDRLQKVWTQDSHGIFQPKGRKKEIMASNLFFLWSQVNLLYLS